MTKCRILYNGYMLYGGRYLRMAGSGLKRYCATVSTFSIGWLGPSVHQWTMHMRFSIQLSDTSGLLVRRCHLWYRSSLVYTLNTGFLKCTLLQVHYISLWCGRGLCYGVKPNGDVVEQSYSKKVNCSEMFQPPGSLSVTKRDQNVSLQLTPNLAIWLLSNISLCYMYLLSWHRQLMNKIHVIQSIF